MYILKLQYLEPQAVSLVERSVTHCPYLPYIYQRYYCSPLCQQVYIIDKLNQTYKLKYKTQKCLVTSVNKPVFNILNAPLFSQVATGLTALLQHLVSHLPLIPPSKNISISVVFSSDTKPERVAYMISLQLVLSTSASPHMQLPILCEGTGMVTLECFVELFISHVT